MRLQTNWRPQGTQYFCLSCVNVSLTPLWSTCMCAARATNFVKCSFLGSSTGNLDWSSRVALSNLPRQRRTALSSRYKHSLQRSGRDSLVSFLESCCISGLKAWPWTVFIHSVMAIDSSWVVKEPVLWSISPDLQFVRKQMTRDVTAKSLFKEL